MTKHDFKKYVYELTLTHIDQGSSYVLVLFCPSDKLYGTDVMLHSLNEMSRPIKLYIL